MTQKLIEATRALLSSLDSTLLRPFLDEWPAGTAQAVVPASLPVLTWLPQVQRDAEPFAAELVSEICRAAPSMSWQQTYRAAVDEHFLRNYGWCELAGLKGPLPSTRVAAGWLLLGPQTTYPSHRHEAEEIYLPLVGVASWLQGDGLWRERSPGELIHHRPHEPHAMRTRAAPLLALYLWRSADLDQQARLDPPARI
ncbi:MAG TPA: dimethylsulfonioproprionate lyase family protein [Steroidobacteraceae bacterium]|nr:dimethylsulfonioproprionate lyase family protein [Steroidobacteraceae bacterium]